MRSLSFTRSSAAPRTIVSPRACEPSSATSGSSSTSSGTSSGVISVAISSAVLHLHVADRLAPGAAAVEDRDARAHPLEHVEQSDASRVEPELVHGHVAAGNERRGDEERRRGREVAGHDELAEPKRARRVDRHRARAFAATRTPPALEHQLRVVARRLAAR